VLDKQQRKQLKKYGKHISQDLFFGKGKYTNLYIFEILALEGSMTVFELAGKLFKKLKGKDGSYHEKQSFSGTIYKAVDKLRKKQYVTTSGTKKVKGSERNLIGLTDKGLSVANIMSLNARSNWFQGYRKYCAAKNYDSQGWHAAFQTFMQILFDSEISQDFAWVINDKPIRDRAVAGLINLDLIDNKAFLEEREEIWRNIWRQAINCMLERKPPPSWYRHMKAEDRKALGKAFGKPEFKRLLAGLFQPLIKKHQTELQKFLTALEEFGQEAKV